MKGIISGNVIIIAQSKSSGTTTAATIVSITIVKPTHLSTINTQVCLVALIPRSITLASVACTW
jgi:hypothetical protein